MNDSSKKYTLALPLIGFCSIFGLLLYYFLIYPAFLSPLAKIPSVHWSSSISPVWILWTRYHKNELSATVKAHEKLGPIIRLGPSDLSVSTYKDGIRTIYGGGFDKSRYYDFFSYYGITNAFSSIHRAEHAIRRRRISAVYTKSALFNSTALASVNREILLNRLIPSLRKTEASKKPIDVLELSYSLCLDYVNCFIFGLSSGSNFLDGQESTKLWLEHYENRYCAESFWTQELPTLTRWLKLIGVDMMPLENASSTKYLEQWLLDMCDRAESYSVLVTRGELQEPGDDPVVYRQVRKAIDIDSVKQTIEHKRLETASELFDHMSGAREVLGLVLGYTIYYISQNSAAQDRLRAELLQMDSPMTVKPEASQEDFQADLPSPASLNTLPYLTSVLKESFRLRPNSTPLPRVAPKDRSVSLAGVDGIPPGTRVNAFQWFMHRDPNKWSRVNQWLPERWLLSEDSKFSDDGPLWAFGSGPRMCVGTNLTQYAMRYMLAAIFSNFKTSVVEDEQFGKHPPGSLEDRLLIKFESIHHS